MTVATYFIIIGLSALTQASFQLSVSVLTLLSGHALSKKASNARLLRLISSFTAGSVSMTLLLLLATIFVIMQLTTWQDISPALWAVSSGLLIGLGIAVYILYYRKESRGTTLWLPRSMAQHLHSRAKATKSSSEAFNLGLGSVLAEIIFIAPPLLVSVLAILALPNNWQFLGIATYTLGASLSTIIVWTLIGGGHSIAKIQRWRETNKRFLRGAAGAGLLILGFYVYVEQVVGLSLFGAGL